MISLKTLTKKTRDKQSCGVQSCVPDAARYRILASEMDDQLQTHVLRCWFPRAMDTQRGGFHQNFARNWKRTKDNERSLIHQSRQIWLAAQAALHDASQKTQWLSYAHHGFEFLSTQLWDNDAGGFFWALDTQGTPVHGGEKHVCGLAFAIFALSDYHLASGDPRALQLAQRTFEWLEEQAYDDVHGSYHEALDRAGRRILKARDARRLNDLIGTRFGRKSSNTILHLLEAFAALLRVWPEELLATRQKQLLALARDTLMVSPGTLPPSFDPDWQNPSGIRSYGHDVETAFLLLDAAASLGKPHDDATWQAAQQLTDQVLDHAWDARYGGCFDVADERGKLRSDQKVWWVQAEACHTFLLLHEKFGGQTLRYWDVFLRQWHFIVAHQLDHRYGGWHHTVSRRGRPLRGQLKSNCWTDGYHQGRALMNMARQLRRMAGCSS
jgi:mannobiose 2-epimerase